jgi:UDP-N-acetylmuramyl pentapeptide phosphotransferase/UDP-N-acetylglucosamine-1-phosphate transferase
MARGLLHAFAGAAIGAVAARAAYAAFTRNRQPDDLTGRWTRKNHRGEPITLLEGPAFVAGAGAAAALTPGLPGRLRLAALVAGAGSGALGAYDDLYGTTSSKGFKGHLTALARGEVTSGAVKILGIGATGLGAAALAGGGPLDVVVNGAAIAGAANLANLFDLRPGRAIKVALLTGGPLLAASLLRGSPAAAALAAVPLGAAAALLPDDLGERAMLGDAGANALGALLGLAAVTRLGRPGRYALLGTVAALTAASEKVSFTKVIAGNPVLNRIDMLGRRPVAPA